MEKSSQKIELQDVHWLPLDVKNLKELQYLSIKTFADAFASVNTAEDMQEYLKKAFSEEQLLPELHDPAVTFYFLKHKQDVLGYCKLKLGLPVAVAENGKALEICRLYVRQEYQGQRLGQWMLDKIIQLAREQKLDFVWLGVWSQNPGAIRLYERNGFVRIGAYTFMLGRDPQTDYIMKKELV